MKEAIYKLVADRDWVTFAELSRDIDGFRGNWAIEAAPNVFFWTALSEEALDALDELFAEKRIVYAPAHPLSYLADGGLLRLPLAKRPNKKGGYKKPHWVPVCRRPRPPDGLGT